MTKNPEKYRLTAHHIAAAEAVLAKGDRVELIPVKDGVKVVRVRREEVKRREIEAPPEIIQKITKEIIEEGKRRPFIPVSIKIEGLK